MKFEEQMARATSTMGASGQAVCARRDLQGHGDAYDAMDEARKALAHPESMRQTTWKSRFEEDWVPNTTRWSFSRAALGMLGKNRRILGAFRG